MSTITPNTSDNSVTFSLAELAKLEEERMRHDEMQRARAREQEARERREEEARRAAAEATRLAAEAEARAKRERAELEEKARIEARERAAVEVARIEAEGRARLEAENAQRAHELAILRVRTEKSRSRVQTALIAALGLVLCGGSLAGYSVSQRVDSLKLEAEQLRDGQATLTRERDAAREAAFSTLDRRYASLRMSPFIKEAEEARAAAEAAKNAIDVKSLETARLRAFSDALDALQTRLDSLEKIASLDRRHADLTAWAAERRRSDATEATRSAAARAKAMPDDSAVRAYEGALNQLRDALARSTSSTGTGSQPPSNKTGGKCTDPNDPLCGFDGRSL
jgi:hypothetical protein